MIPYVTLESLICCGATENEQFSFQQCVRCLKRSLSEPLCYRPVAKGGMGGNAPLEIFWPLLEKNH
jgi:hypothetical protein